MLKDVVEVRVLAGHRLFVRFEDGMQGEVDVATTVRFDGVFALLADPEKFAEARVNPDLGIVCWPNGADLDPDVLYSWISGRPISV
jgi:hypothetical protein